MKAWLRLAGAWFWIDPLNDMTVTGQVQNLSGSTPGTRAAAARNLGQGRLSTDRRFN